MYIYYTKFSKVCLLEIILAPLALYLSLKAVICNPVTLQQVLCIPAFLGICSWAAHQAVWSWHCLTNSNDHILFLLQPETPRYILICEMVFVTFKDYLQARKRGSKQQKGQETQTKIRLCYLGSVGILWDVAQELAACGAGHSEHQCSLTAAPVYARI